ncbi:MAG: aldehyde dehydrogenase family protein, partial [Ectothiorhodospiraceae bacterium]|nr:aldehyde dehydrogenase family protein [Ectothiorhodospiraceae bacterium]
MTMSSVNPANGSIIHVFDTWDHGRIEKALALAERSFAAWSVQGFERRAACLHKAADLLHHRREHYAGIITLEMGKLHREALAEIDKCAWGCEYYADNAALFLADEPVETEAAKSAIVYQPLGCVLAIMPWNFPFWQVFRFAAPALMAGNTVLLKHASNVPHCAQAIEEVLRDAGVPEGVFQSMLVTADKVEAVIADRRVSAVTLTGSDAAGRAVAAAAGTHLKKAVLELGGSDAFVVLEDADLDRTVEQAVVARFQNAGQSCIAAKRFIVVDAIADRFVARFRDAVQALRHGDPMNEATTIGPLARVDLRDALHEQVSAS